MFYIIFIAVAVSFAILIWLIFDMKKKMGEKPREDNSAILMLQEQLKEMRQALQGFGAQVDNRMGDSAKMIQQQANQSILAIKDVTERLTKLDETNKQVMSVADQLQGLEDVLKNPKHRGVLGEYFFGNSA